LRGVGHSYFKTKQLGHPVRGKEVIDRLRGMGHSYFKTKQLGQSVRGK
jgi:hypothetical protein